MLVEKTVSRIAQDMLLEHGITLVINVKPVSTFLKILSSSFVRHLNVSHLNPVAVIACLWMFEINLSSTTTASPGPRESDDSGRFGHFNGPASDKTSLGDLPQVLSTFLPAAKR